MENKYVIQDYLKGMTLLLMGIGVGLQNSVFYTIGIIFSLIAASMDKSFFCNKKNSKFCWTVFLFLAFSLLYGTIAVFQGNYIEAKSALRLYKSLIPVIIMFIFIHNPRDYFKWAVIGFLLSVVYNDLFVFHQFINGDLVFGARYKGLFWGPNALGSFVELAMPVLMYYCYFFRKNYKFMIIGIAIVIGTLFSLYLSGSRGAIMAVMVEAIIGGFILFNKKRGDFYRSNLLRNMIVMCIVSIGCMFVYSQIFTKSYDGERILLWVATWQMFLDHPFIGIGLDNWNDIYATQYISVLAKEPDLPFPHNVFLHILSGIGLIGFIPFMVMIFLQIKTALKYSVLDFIETKRYFSIMDMILMIIAGMLVHSLVDEAIIYRFYMTVYLFFWGLCCYRMGEIDEAKVSNE